MYSDPRHWTLCVCVFCWLLDLCFFFCAVNKSLSFLKSKLTNHPRQHVVLFLIYFLCSQDHLFTFVSTSTISCCLLRTLPLHLDPPPCFPVYLNPYFPFPSFPSKFILPPFSLSPPSLPFTPFFLCLPCPYFLHRVFLWVYLTPYFPCLLFPSRDSTRRPPALKLSPLSTTLSRALLKTLNSFVVIIPYRPQSHLGQMA